MSMSFFSPSVAQNVVWSGEYNALSSTVINDTNNRNKALYIDGSNITQWGANEANKPVVCNALGRIPYVVLPLPDISTLTAGDNNKQLVFDFATLSFILKNLLPLYDIKADSQRLYYYEFSVTNFSAGVIYEAGGKTAFNCNTLYGIFTLADNNRAIQINNNSGGGFKVPLGKPSGYSSNWSVTYMVNSQLVAGNQPQNSNVQFLTGNGFVNNTIYNLSNNANNNFYVLDSDSGAPSALSTASTTLSNVLPQNQISIITYANIDNIAYIYLNGVQKANTAFNNVLVSPSDVFYSGNPSSSINQMCGLTYAICSMQDATISKLQKVEGAMKWNNRYSGLTITLDSSHPYFSSAPTV